MLINYVTQMIYLFDISIIIHSFLPSIMLNRIVIFVHSTPTIILFHCVQCKRQHFS